MINVRIVLISGEKETETRLTLADCSQVLALFSLFVRRYDYVMFEDDNQLTLAEYRCTNTFADVRATLLKGAY